MGQTKCQKIVIDYEKGTSNDDCGPLLKQVHGQKRKPKKKTTKLEEVELTGLKLLPSCTEHIQLIVRKRG